jgi:hypothetical protein
LIVGHVSNSIVGIEKAFRKTPTQRLLYPSLSVIGMQPPDLCINRMCFALVVAAIRHVSEDSDNSSSLESSLEQQELAVFGVHRAHGMIK